MGDEDLESLKLQHKNGNSRGGGGGKAKNLPWRVKIFPNPDVYTDDKQIIMYFK